MRPLTLVHLSDLHFGRDVDLDQVAALEGGVRTLRPDAVIVSGDLTQRARHGEFQGALAFVQQLGRQAPTLVVPGNHDVQWWGSPWSLLGDRPKYVKYRRYFGEELSPRLEIGGAVIAGALSSYGVTFGSMTWNLNDLAVKGHLPAAELGRVGRYFETAPPELVRVVVLHHNVLRGAISRRMGLARWRTAQDRLGRTGADLVLCGHDHQEGSGQIDGTVVVSTAGTHTSRSRGGRPSAFNVVSVNPTSIDIQHMRWHRESKEFVPGDLARYGRVRAVP
ncbi:MAG: metallophosphoesterase [Gemmatimonadales bacterium]|nr:metallophosphoesterase [Gemmatimonadales bacterium]